MQESPDLFPNPPPQEIPFAKDFRLANARPGANLDGFRLSSSGERDAPESPR